MGLAMSSTPSIRCFKLCIKGFLLGHLEQLNSPFYLHLLRDSSYPGGIQSTSCRILVVPMYLSVSARSWLHGLLDRSGASMSYWRSCVCYRSRKSDSKGLTNSCWS
ncbi:hypothetical protein OF83DRAFT_840137 [Amylostereum chailletii]|nr:hypothetical protein OF83DRAFT_840137 [Amylostereum chailletii]